jgi:hypothetical protein
LYLSDDVHIGGFDEQAAFEHVGKLIDLRAE